MSTDKTLSKVLNIELDLIDLDVYDIIEHLEDIVKIKTLSEILGLEVDVNVIKFEKCFDLDEMLVVKDEKEINIFEEIKK